MGLRALLLLPLCFPALQARAPDAEETLLEGSTLQIHCPYTAVVAERRKAWCRVRDDECKVLVETQPPYRYRVTKRKVTIQDILWNTSVSITMSNLQVEDSGTYSCAYRFDYSRYIPLKTISLLVWKGGTPNSFPSASAMNPSDSTETTVNSGEEMKENRLQTFVWPYIGLMSSKILAAVILAILTRMRMRNSTLEASRGQAGDNRRGGSYERR